MSAPLIPDNLHIRRVKTLEEAQVVRCIRNSGKEFMTSITTDITEQQQQEWWESIDHNKIQLFLYSVEGVDVGFGMIREIEEKLLLTLAILPSYRGSGLGTFIYHHLLACYHRHPVYIDVLFCNQSSLSAAIKAGFKIIGVDQTNKFIKMKGNFDTR